MRQNHILQVCKAIPWIGRISSSFTLASYISFKMKMSTCTMLVITGLLHFNTQITLLHKILKAMIRIDYLLAVVNFSHDKYERSLSVNWSHFLPISWLWRMIIPKEIKSENKDDANCVLKHFSKSNLYHSIWWTLDILDIT